MTVDIREAPNLNIHVFKENVKYSFWCHFHLMESLLLCIVSYWLFASLYTFLIEQRYLNAGPGSAD